MNTLYTKTRVKNIQKQPVFLRWLTRGGTMLNPGQEVIVDGLYPSHVDKDVYLSQCVYDIASGRVEVELITNMRSRKPSTEELKATPARASKQPGAPANPVPTTVKPEEGASAKVDERWSRGGIEDMKPPAKVLPGHEDTLATAGVPESTAFVFENGPAILPPDVSGAVDTATSAAPAADAPSGRRRGRVAN